MFVAWKSKEVGWPGRWKRGRSRPVSFALRQGSDPADDHHIHIADGGVVFFLAAQISVSIWRLVVLTGRRHIHVTGRVP